MWRHLRVLACATACALLVIGCETGDGDCAPVGSPQPCGCQDGARDGQRLCLPDGQWSACRCAAARTVPCGDPGVAFACYCGDAGVGVEICLGDGSYSDCMCDGSVGAADAGGPVGGGGEAVDAPADCPAPFACVSQMGATFCAEGGGIPPLCDVDDDCAVAGLPAAACIDPGIGFSLCAQACVLR